MRNLIIPLALALLSGCELQSNPAPPAAVSVDGGEARVSVAPELVSVLAVERCRRFKRIDYCTLRNVAGHELKLYPLNALSYNQAGVQMRSMGMAGNVQPGEAIELPVAAPTLTPDPIARVVIQ